MNTELLFSLYAIHSPSGGEKKMRRFIRKYISKNCGDVEMTTDVHGNLLCTKGKSETYPCLASHMDQVQRSHSKDFRVVTDGHVCFGYSDRAHMQQGLGADDKNGILICLECLKAFDVLKVAFFVGEETGCVGSSAVNLAFFKDCRFVIQPDRRGSSDLITSMFCGDVCSEAFIRAIGAERFGYSEDEGSITDVGELTERGVGISCLNLSCGYYEAHTEHEFTVLPELENCLNFVMHIVSECREVFPFTGDYGGYYRRWYGYGRTCLGTLKGGSYTDGRSQCTALGTTDVKVTSGDEQYYCDSGMYDEDYSTMEDYLEADPTLTFEQIWQNYGFDFQAQWEFGGDYAKDVLRDIYEAAKDMMSSGTYSHDDFWDDDEPVLKKVS